MQASRVHGQGFRIVLPNPLWAPNHVDTVKAGEALRFTIGQGKTLTAARALRQTLSNVITLHLIYLSPRLPSNELRDEATKTSYRARSFGQHPPLAQGSPDESEDEEGDDNAPRRKTR